DIADQKREIGMRLARLRDHAGAEIHADAERRFERGEEVAGAASELEHAGAFGDEELEIAQILLMEEGGPREPFPAVGRARVGEAADVALARRHAAFAAICARVHPHPYTRFNVHLPKLRLGAHCGVRSIPWTRTGAGVLSALQRKTRNPGRMLCLARRSRAHSSPPT